MKKLFVLSFLLTAKFAFGQGDSVNHYIKKLNWNSFDVFYGFAPNISLADDAKKILYFTDSQKVSKLIKALSDKQKVVAAHLLLSKIFDSVDFSFSLGSQCNGEESTGTTFKYNQLGWSRSFSGVYNIKKVDIQTIKSYWLRRRKELLNK